MFFISVYVLPLCPGSGSNTIMKLLPEIIITVWHPQPKEKPVHKLTNVNSC